MNLPGKIFITFIFLDKRYINFNNINKLKTKKQVYLFIKFKVFRVIYCLKSFYTLSINTCISLDSFKKNQIKALEYINKLLSEALINILVTSISGYHKKVLLHMCTQNYYSVYCILSRVWAKPASLPCISWKTKSPFSFNVMAFPRDIKLVIAIMLINSSTAGCKQGKPIWWRWDSRAMLYWMGECVHCMCASSVNF